MSNQRIEQIKRRMINYVESLLDNITSSNDIDEFKEQIANILQESPLYQELDTLLSEDDFDEFSEYIENIIERRRQILLLNESNEKYKNKKDKKNNDYTKYKKDRGSGIENRKNHYFYFNR